MATRRYGARSVETSNEDKVLFADIGLTKGELIDYYERIAPRILPHLRGRPLVMQRFPDGIAAEGFYQKQIPDYFPDWMSRARVELLGSGGRQQLVVCDSKASLGYLANQACVALHPWLARADRLHQPDQLVVDLDPPADDFEAARRAALRVRELFEELEVACFAKLTGSRGVHVVAPLDAGSDFDAVRDFAADAMELLVGRHPEALTSAQRKRERGDRVYLDIGRNAYAQTAVAAWSVRALPGAPVAVPVAWSDLERSGIGPRDYTVENVFRRIARRDDPWAGWRRRARSIEPARERLARLRGG